MYRKTFGIFLLAYLLTAVFANQKTVHLVMHSHDDVGWLTTVDGYYKGGAAPFPPYACVSCTLNKAYDALMEKDSRIFNVVEMAFFKLFYDESDPAKKANIKNLVQKGQFFILNGGWVMNDEGAAYYEDIIEQFAVGQRFAFKEFGVHPRIGWHIDPFGHSGGMSMIFSQMGYDAFFIERIDFQDLEKRKAQKELEFIWRPPSNNPLLNSQFVHLNSMKYGPYPLSLMCGGPNCNLPQDYSNAGGNFYEFMKRTSDWFKGDVLFHHAGDDFEIIGPDHYRGMEGMAQNIQAAADLNMTVKISSPQGYIDDLYNDFRAKKLMLNYKTDDFFPYQDNAGAYWVGYFTSRPYLKYRIRESGRLLRNLRKFISLESIHFRTNPDAGGFSVFEGAEEQLELLAEAVAVGQHHDAVTGTAKTFVNDDYIARIEKAMLRAREYINNMIGRISGTKSPIQCVINYNMDLSPGECREFYQGIDVATANDIQARFVLFNPRERDVGIYKMWVPKVNFTVTNIKTKETIPSYMICDLHSFKILKQDNSNRYKHNECQLWIPVEVPAYSSLEILVKSNKANALRPLESTTYQTTDTKVFKVDNRTELTLLEGLTRYKLSTLSDEKVWDTQEFSVRYMAYNSQSGGISSGAYILKIAGGPEPAITEAPDHVAVYETPHFLMFETTGKDESRIASIMVLHKNHVARKGIEVTSTLAPLQQQHELILRVKLEEFNNNNVFYTDMSGYDMIRRITGFRKKKDIAIHDDISGNYYPMYVATSMDDDSTRKRFVLMNDRSQSSASFNEGEIEVLLQRRCAADDGRGLGEAIFDDHATILHHYILIGQKDQIGRAQRVKQVEIEQPFLLIGGFHDPEHDIVPHFNANVEDKFPRNRIEELTLKYYVEPVNNAHKVLLKVQNMDPKETQFVPIFIKDNETNILSQFFDHRYYVGIKSIEEMTITGTESIWKMLERRKYWNCMDENKCRKELVDAAFHYTAKNESMQVIKLLPLQTRNFEIEIESVRERPQEEISTEGTQSTARVVDPHLRTKSHSHVVTKRCLGSAGAVKAANSLSLSLVLLGLINMVLMFTVVQ